MSEPVGCAPAYDRPCVAAAGDPVGRRDFLGLAAAATLLAACGGDATGPAVPEGFTLAVADYPALAAVGGAAEPERRSGGGGAHRLRLRRPVARVPPPGGHGERDRQRVQLPEPRRALLLRRHLGRRPAHQQHDETLRQLRLRNRYAHHRVRSTAADTQDH